MGGFLGAHAALVWGVLFAISELLDAIPSLQASSIWKLVYGIVASIAAPKPPVA